MDNSKDNPAKIFKFWVGSYSDNLYLLALFKTSSKKTAEDLVQETLLAAFKSYGSFKLESNAKSLLLAILNNKIKDYYRKRFQGAALVVMCRNTFSIGRDGYIYDCDFNQMLDLKVEASAQHMSEFNAAALNNRNNWKTTWF